MMNYTFNICELDAEALQANQQPFEHEDAYLERLRSAKGKHFFRVLVQVGEEKQLRLDSPYFEKVSDQQRFSGFAKAMKEAKKVVVAYERNLKKGEVQAGEAG